MLNPWVGFILRVTPSSTLQVTPSFTPQVTPVWHSASLPKQHLASDLHLTVCTPTLHCLDSCTSLPRQPHSTVWTAALHHTQSCIQLHTLGHPSLTLQVTPSLTPQVAPVWHPASLPKQHLALHLHLTDCTPTLHCSDGSPPFVPRYSQQKNNHKFHINNIAFVFHKSFHKLQSFFKTSIDP